MDSTLNHKKWIRILGSKSNTYLDLRGKNAFFSGVLITNFDPESKKTDTTVSGADGPKNANQTGSGSATQPL